MAFETGAAGYDVKITRAGLYKFSQACPIGITSTQVVNGFSAAMIWIEHDTGGGGVTVKTGMPESIAFSSADTQWDTIGKTTLVAVPADTSYRMRARYTDDPNNDDYTIQGDVDTSGLGATLVIEYVGSTAP